MMRSFLLLKSFYSGIRLKVERRAGICLPKTLLHLFSGRPLGMEGACALTSRDCLERI
jgi:hypothetical protein